MQRLEADNYATLGLFIPLLVKLFSDLDSMSSKMVRDMNSILRIHRGGTDESNAMAVVIKFIAKLRSNLQDRIDPFNTSEANAPYLAATFLLPIFNTFSFFTEEAQRTKAIKAAKKQVLKDMEHV